MKKAIESSSRISQWDHDDFSTMKTDFFTKLAEYQREIVQLSRFHAVLERFSGTDMRPLFMRSHAIELRLPNYYRINLEKYYWELFISQEEDLLGVEVLEAYFSF